MKLHINTYRLKKFPVVIFEADGYRITATERHTAKVEYLSEDALEQEHWHDFPSNTHGTLTAQIILQSVLTNLLTQKVKK